MNTSRFITSWILSALVMFIMSYSWHGVILNDFANVAYPLPFFLTMLGLVYVIIGFGLTALFTFVNIERRQLFTRVAVGSAIGFFIYLIAFTLGVSFKAGGAMQHTMIDFLWQMLEQGTGAMFINAVFVLAKRRQEILEG
jgi:hypothetical protein